MNRESNTQNGAELGTMMTARDDVLNERLGSITIMFRGWQSRSSNTELKADAEELKALIACVELMQGNYLSKSEAKIGAGVTQR